MDQDDQLSLPSRRPTTTTSMNVDHAERVHSDLLQAAAARQAYEQQQQPVIPMKRERKFCLVFWNKAH